MAQPASGKPSLIDTAPSLGGSAHESSPSIRMLDALDASEKPAGGRATRRGFVWALGGVLVLVACGASWSWWSQRSHADDIASRIAQVVNASPTSAAVLPTVPAMPASAPSLVTEVSPAATIIAVPQSMPPAMAEPASAAAAASAPAASASEAMPSVEAMAGAAAASAAQAKPKAPAPARDTRVAAQSSAERKPASRAPAANRTAVATPNNDPDVALLSAMLATMSRDARANADSTPSPQTQLTIAQLVQRCEQRSVKDAIETFECKRRICDGYWGKADACPKSLSPKKN